MRSKMFMPFLFVSSLAFSQGPSVVAVSPLNGTKISTIFSMTVTDPNGIGDLSTIRFLMNRSADGVRGCYVGHVVGTNTLWLRNDANDLWEGSTSFGTGATVSNSQCSITGIGALATTLGANYTLTIPVTFKRAFSGLQYSYLRVWDENNLGANDWIPQGHWIVPDMDTASVLGLADQLAARPIRGPGFFAGRAAVINASGELNSASGPSADCLHVDGTSGPCLAGASIVKIDRFDFRAGPITQTLTLNATPVGEVQVYRNGLLQFPAVDYDRIGSAVISLRPGSFVTVSDLVQVMYFALP